MSFVDRALTGAGILIAATLARSSFKDAMETKRRRDSPLHFDDGLTREQFSALARETGRGTPRVDDLTVRGMALELHVRSNSGLSAWAAVVDFNDYGHLTGEYWISSENADSLIPEHFAKELQARIRSHVSTRREP